MFRTSQNGQVPIVDVDTLDELEPVIRSIEPGRYHIDQLERDPLPSGHTSRRWGVGIKRADGSVVLEPDPWPDSTAGRIFALGSCGRFSFLLFTLFE
jgi:hypothetical protein